MVKLAIVARPLTASGPMSLPWSMGQMGWGGWTYVTAPPAAQEDQPALPSPLPEVAVAVGQLGQHDHGCTRFAPRSHFPLRRRPGPAGPAVPRRPGRAAVRHPIPSGAAIHAGRGCAAPKLGEGAWEPRQMQPARRPAACRTQRTGATHGHGHGGGDFTVGVDDLAVVGAEPFDPNLFLDPETGRNPQEFYRRFGPSAPSCRGRSGGFEVHARAPRWSSPSSIPRSSPRAPWRRSTSGSSVPSHPFAG